MKPDKSKKLKMHTLLSVLTIAIGAMVLVYGIFVEDEPTLVALLLIACGAAWYFITRARIRSQQEPD